MLTPTVLAPEQLSTRVAIATRIGKEKAKFENAALKCHLNLEILHVCKVSIKRREKLRWGIAHGWPARAT